MAAVWRFGFLALLLVVLVDSAPAPKSPKADLNCSLSQALVDEIAGYRPAAQLIADHIQNGSAKGMTYNYLAEFVDKFGSRQSGSQNLEDSIDYMVSLLQTFNMQNVHTETAVVQVWKRNSESLTMIQPRNKTLTLLGLGSTIGTPPDGITAPIIVVKSFDELSQVADQVPGKIVVYNEPWVGYGDTVAYRSHGAAKAAGYGAVAALIRSVTSFSIYSPHTGWQDYDSSVPKIPAACIAVEDAEMFQRMTDKGETVVLHLYMEAENLADAISRNTIADYSGTTYPKEVVIVSGHIDSWDVGQGAMDDGGGAFISVMAPYVLGQLGLTTKRPVRTILWTAEEAGYQGAYAYAAQHATELADFNIVLESDDGTFNPTGLSFSGNTEATCIMQEILNLSDVVDATQLTTPDGGSDSTVFSQLGVPSGSLTDEDEKYWWFHHSNGDTMTVQDPDEMDRCLVMWTITSYVLADLSIKLPRNTTTKTFP